MINRFLKRLEDQKMANVGFSQPLDISKQKIETVDEENKPVAQDEPLSSSDIKKFLEKISNKNMEPTPNSITFNSIQNFVGWYESNAGGFDEKQKTAIGTLIHTKSMINLGCSCRLTERQRMADNYYKDFFTRNKNTPLIPKIKELARVETLIFLIGEEEFLRV